MIAALFAVIALLDFGDAPDNVTAGYAARPAVVAHFPSKAASAGPRHGRLGPRLGTERSLEADTRQVNRDADDGAALTLHSCATSTLTVIVDGHDLPPGADVIHVNAWFDWNQDGDWRDGAVGTCGPEWGVQNFALRASDLGPDKVATFRITFRAGRAPDELWWRAQVQAEASATNDGGAGSAYRGGETEDSFTVVRTGKNDPPGDVPFLDCFDAYQITRHGLNNFTAFNCSIKGVRPTVPLFFKRARPSVTGEKDAPRGFMTAVVPRRAVDGSFFIQMFADQAPEHHRRPPVQHLVFHWTVDLEVGKDKRRVTLTKAIPFAISHSLAPEPQQAEQHQLGPARPQHPKPEPPAKLCVTVQDFVVDGNRVPDLGFWNPGVSLSFPDRTVIRSVELTDTATGRRPPAGFFGPLVHWEEVQKRFRDHLERGRYQLDLFTTLSDANPNGKPSGPSGRWRFRVTFAPPTTGGACDVKVR